jgi:ubiquinone/menaquinone biosynthesis C-methylase UbiE
VRRFPGPSDLAAAFGRAGFDGVGWKLMGGGIVALHVGTKR